MPSFVLWLFWCRLHAVTFQVACYCHFHCHFQFEFQSLFFLPPSPIKVSSTFTKFWLTFKLEFGLSSSGCICEGVSISVPLSPLTWHVVVCDLRVKILVKSTQFRRHDFFSTDTIFNLRRNISLRFPPLIPPSILDILCTCLSSTLRICYVLLLSRQFLFLLQKFLFPFWLKLYPFLMENNGGL